MTTKRDIKADLDALIKRASAKQSAALKVADTSAKIDGADDGTSAASTGAHASSMAAEQKKTYPDNMVDTGAADNKAGGSVAASTDGATAAAVDGQSGAKGADLEIVKDADNGDEKPQNKIDGNGGATGSFKEAAAEARKLAQELRKSAAATLSPFDRFLVQAIRNSPDEQVKTAALAADDGELAAAASGNLAEQIEGGQLSEEDAQKILEEALASGALTEEDLAAAAAELQAPAADPAAAAPAADPAAAAPVTDMTEIDAAAAPELEAKIAAADVGPESPKYIEKLARFYAEDIQAGASFALHLARKLASSDEGENGGGENGEGGEKEKEKEEGKKEGEENGNPAPAAPAPAPAPAAPLMGAPMTELPPAQTPEEQAALEAVKAELGLTDEQLAQILASEAGPMDKTAALKASYRTAILNRVAAIRQ